MSTQIESAGESATDVLPRVREVGLELISRHFASAPTRRRRNLTVLQILVAHLETLPVDRVAHAPIALRQADIQALRARLAGRDPLSSSACARVGALAWLLHQLDQEGVVAAPPLKLSLQRRRDLAVQVTEESFCDEGLLSQRLTPALLERLRPMLPRDDASHALTTVIALVWEGAVVVPSAPRVLARLRLADYDWSRGRVRLRPHEAGTLAPGSRRVDGARHPCSRWVYLRTAARGILNAYILHRLRAGTLDLGDPEALLFPALATISERPAKSGLTAVLAACLATLIGDDAAAITPQRLVTAARVRALATFPPLVVAALSNKLLSSPTRDEELLQLEEPHPALPATSPVTRSIRVKGARPARREPAPTEGRARGPWDGLTYASYFDAREGLRGVQRLLLKRESLYPRNVVLTSALRVLTRLEADLLTLSAPIPAQLANLRLLLSWVVWQLRHPNGTRELRQRNARASVAARMSTMDTIVDALVGDRALSALMEDDWIDLTIEAMACIPGTAQSKKLMRARLKAFHKYLLVFESPPEAPIAPVNWATRELAISSVVTESPLLLPWEIAAVQGRLRQMRDQELAETFDLLVILASENLRGGEACGLPLHQIHCGLETLVEIRRSKSPSGRRWVPLHCQLSASELQRFRHLVANRKQRAAGDPAALLLATTQHPTGFDPKELSRAVSKVIAQVTRKPLTLHSLRHTYASLFPLRWFVAFYGREAARSLGALLETPLFQEEALARFRQLFVATTWDGQTVTTDPFPILAILMGHSGPEVTVTVYVHTIEWFQRLYVDLEVSRRVEPSLSMEEAAGALCWSLPTTYKVFPDGKKGRRIPCSQVVETQVRLLKECSSSGRSRPLRSTVDTPAEGSERGADS